MNISEHKFTAYLREFKDWRGDPTHSITVSRPCMNEGDKLYRFRKARLVMIDKCDIKALCGSKTYADTEDLIKYLQKNEKDFKGIKMYPVVSYGYTNEGIISSNTIKKSGTWLLFDSEKELVTNKTGRDVKRLNAQNHRAAMDKTINAFFKENMQVIAKRHGMVINEYDGSVHFKDNNAFNEFMKIAVGQLLMPEFEALGLKFPEIYRKKRGSAINCWSTIFKLKECEVPLEDKVEE